MSIRPERVANAIKREISAIIREELKDPRIGFTTITKVEVAPDLRIAKVYYSVLGTEKQKKSTAVALRRAKGFIKGFIGDRLQLRFVPDLLFMVDKSIEYHDRINKLLEKIHQEDEKRKKEVRNGDQGNRRSDPEKR